MDDNVENDILHRDEIGQNTERLKEGKLSVGDKMSKRKLRTYKSANASTKVRVGDNVVKIKEERGLLQRFIVISRSRPELDLKECIGTYEFGVLPRSLFASDGSLLLAYDKASILHHLEKLSSNPQMSHTDVETNQPPAYRVVIIDGMAVVNSVTKTDQMKTCQDFADSFLATICNIAENYD